VEFCSFPDTYSGGKGLKDARLYLHEISDLKLETFYLQAACDELLIIYCNTLQQEEQVFHDP